MKRSERGSSLIEVVVAVAIIVIATTAILSATMGAAHRFGPDPIREALQHHVQREMRIAIDLLKYQGASLASATAATSIPLPGASPLPAHVSLTVSALPQGGTAIALTAQSDADSSKTVTMQTIIAHPAPLPSSTVQSNLTVAAPVGSE